MEIFHNEEGILHTVRIAKPDGNEATVNVSHLIPLEIYSELNDPKLHNVQADVSEEIRILMSYMNLWILKSCLNLAQRDHSI